MKPFVKEYMNDEQLEQDIKRLKANGVPEEDVYVLSHDADRTSRIAKNAGSNTIGLKEMDLGSAVGNLFHKKGDELRTKIKEMGFTQLEANEFEAKLDKGKVLLMVTNEEDVAHYLN